MIDILAVANRKWCGWCFEENDDTAWNRFWGLNVAEKKEHWRLRKRFAIWMSFTVCQRWLPVWKIAAWWHYRYHDRLPRRWRDL